VATDDLDIESGRLWALGALGIEEQVLDGGHSALLATFATAPPVDAVGDSVVVPDAEAGTRRPFATTVRVEPFLIAPPWELELRPDDPSGPTILSIDPGEAFGHGGHPTTRLALAALAALDVRGRAVGDIGCGSGVIAVAAAALGAAPIIAIDSDPGALAATRRNLTANGVSRLVEVIDGDAAGLDRALDLAVVNVTIDVHEHIARRVGHVTSERIVAGGILADQIDRVVAAYSDFTVAAQRAAGEWRSLELVRAESGD
jgi:ribosomal protein L11 methyltransferase